MLENWKSRTMPIANWIITEPENILKLFSSSFVQDQKKGWTYHASFSE